ncbi:phosphoglucomutase, putative, partial [Perkinsus marinus ATCC 50983]
NSDDVDYIINNNSDDTVFTVSEKQQNGSWFNFSGDEVGLLLGDWQLLMARNRGVPAENCLLLSTIFSSRMLAGLCRYYCCRYVETLPGFNHLTSTSIKLVNDDPDWVHCLAYDESNEFALTLTVPDSDGVSAAAVWCEMANFWRVNKKITMKQRLDQLQQTIGYYVRDNGYYYNPHHSTELGKIFEDLRSGGKYMDILGNSKISHVRDFTRGIDTRGSSGKSSFPVVSECDIITLYFANGLAVTLRSCGKKL